MGELKKILLVDDDKSYNFLNRLLFQACEVDCDVHDVSNGKQALEYLSNCTECPDAILLDLNMPVMDGHRFLKEFEEKSKCAEHTKIFILTSSGLEEDKANALAYGSVKGYFDKPLSPRNIEKIISACVMSNSN